MSYINILGSLYVYSKQSKFYIIERNNLQIDVFFLVLEKNIKL